MRKLFLLLFVALSISVWAQKEYSISNKNPYNWAPLAMGEVNVHTTFTNSAASAKDTTFHLALVSSNLPAGWLLGLCSDAQCYTVNPGFSQDMFTEKGNSTDLKCTFSYNFPPSAGSASASFLIYRIGMMNLADTIVFRTTAPASGVSSTSKNISVTISPNPVKNDLILLLSDNNITSLSIINLVGKEVMILDYAAGKSFDVSTLPNGIYFLRITKGEATFNKKFVISK